MFWNFCVEIHRHSALTDEVIKSHLVCETRKFIMAILHWKQGLLTGRLAQLVVRRTREHVSGLYRCGFESPAGQLKLLIVFRMRR